MKRLFIPLLMSAALAGCASGPSAFGPAQDYNSVGFKNTQLEKDRFRVSYTANHPAEAQDYALLRAAQITLDEGYSHFEILNGNLADNSSRSGLSSSVGVGFGGGGYRRGGTSVGVGVGVNDIVRTLEGDRVTNSIEIKLLSSGGTGSKIYNAQSVADSIRPQVYSGP